MSVVSTWAGTARCRPAVLTVARGPDDVEAALAAAVGAGHRLRVLGRGHSPSDIALTRDHILRLDGLSGVLDIDPPSGLVRVAAGASIASIGAAAAAAGLAFPVLGSIDDQTIAGAVATATHGTGLDYGALSTLVEGARLVTPVAGSVHVGGDAGPAPLGAVRTHLGCLGVLTELTLRLVPAFDLEVEEQPAALDDTLARLEDTLAAVDHYRFWYLPHVGRVWEWKAMRRPPGDGTVQHSGGGPSWSRDRAVGYHALQALLFAALARPQLIPAINRWYADRLFNEPRRSRGPAHAQFTFDCLFRQRVDEWAIPAERAAPAVAALARLVEDGGFQVHLPIEVRFTAADDVWLSPAHGRATCYIGVIAYRPYGIDSRHTAFFDAFDRLMASFDGRPHWAKQFSVDADWLAGRYPRWRDFMAVRARLDPRGVMANDWTDRVMGKVAPPAEVAA